jgi:uncharacterized protein YndB with AHSA1/START domain
LDNRVVGTETIVLSAIIPAPAGRLYGAWLDANEHAKMTKGGAATVEAHVGGKHSAHDGYIWGSILELEPGKRIVQTWRTPEFPADHHDSRLEVSFTDVDGGAEVTIAHSSIPEGQGVKYEDGWREFYFKPMARYFAPRPPAKAKPKKKPVKPKPAAKKAKAKAPATKKKAAPKKRATAKRKAAKRGK